MIKKLLALMTVGILLSSCRAEIIPNKILLNEAMYYSTQRTSEFLYAKNHTTNEATISIVGDVMIHSNQLKYAKKEEGFDFSDSFRYIKDYVGAADYSICNLETTLAGANNGRRFGPLLWGYSGYPTFNSPDILAYNLKEAGFDMTLLANNHTLDSRLDGALRTTEVVDKAGLHFTGVNKDKTDDKYSLLDINGIKIAIMNYTYAMNGFTLDEEKDYAINHFNNYDEKYIDDMIHEAEKMLLENADINIFAIHYGVEYTDYPSEKYQIDIVNRLLDAGIDVVFGGHPHVLQPIDYREDGKFVVYSLGNFISSQMNYYTHYPTDFGVVLSLTFEKTDDEKAIIKSISYLPTYCYKNSENTYVVPALNLPENIQLSPYDYSRIEHLENIVLPRVLSLYKGEKTVSEGKVVINLNK